MKRIAVLLLLLCILAALPACAGKAQESGKLKAVASAFPEYDLLRAVGGDLVDVTLLLKPSGPPPSLFTAAGKATPGPTGCWLPETWEASGSWPSWTTPCSGRRRPRSI